MLAAGLNEKAGRAGEPGGLASLGVVILAAGPIISMADLGRRPDVRGVEADIGFDGKTNGGLGGGPLGADTSSPGVSKESFKSIMPPMGSES